MIFIKTFAYTLLYFLLLGGIIITIKSFIRSTILENNGSMFGINSPPDYNELTIGIILIVIAFFGIRYLGNLKKSEQIK